jgi:3-oxoacyl-[acyl-carrier-protein] synthase II
MTRDELGSMVLAKVGEALGAQAAPAPSDSFFDLGGDSLSALIVIDELEQALGVEVPLEVLLEPDTLGATGDALYRIHTGELDKQ